MPHESSAPPPREPTPPVSRGGRGIRLVRHALGERPRWPEQATLTARDPGPRTAAGDLWRGVTRVLIGQPIPATHADERLSRVKALAVPSSDAISSVAYRPEAALLALVAIGLVRVFILHGPAADGVPRAPVAGGEAVGVLLVLKAMAQLDQAWRAQSANHVPRACGTVVTSVPYHLEREPVSAQVRHIIPEAGSQPRARS
ncbi:MAG TPA: hypothetical protein VKV73_30040 [Chloroflexota bacterium]|nr:hypothetical protein [Chloroflexota bacterium]